jgi:hypothetical protein
MAHNCKDFWNPVAGILFEFLEGATPPVGPGDGLDMSQQTYLSLCSLQRAIEDAVGIPPGDIREYTGPAGELVLPANQEEVFRLAVEQMVAGLQNDRYDWVGPPDQHESFSPSPPGWMNTGVAQSGALQILYVAPPLPGSPKSALAAGTDLYGRVRSSLGS